MMPAESRHQTRPDVHLPSVQAMRAVAALFVAFYHVESHFDGTWWQVFYDTVFARGHMGVDMFFVLSGFLMTYLRPERPGLTVASKFLFRRFLRIWPNYVLASLLYVYIVYPEGAANLMTALLFQPLGENPSLVLGFPPLFVGWTLNYEAYFYLICGVSLLLVGKNKFPALLLAWGVATLVLMPLVYGQNVLTRPLEVPAAPYPALYLALMSNPIIWEFILGALVAVVINHNHARIMALSQGTARNIGLVSMLFFLVLFLLLDNKMEPVACGIPSAILLAGLVIADMRQSWKVPKWFEHLGDASYGIYLMHPLWIFLFGAWLEMSVTVEVLAVVAVIVTTSLSALLIYHLFESPLMRVGRRILSSR